MKYGGTTYEVLTGESRPARGAWVEIAVKANHEIKPIVAPRKGRVG